MIVAILLCLYGPTEPTLQGIGFLDSNLRNSQAFRISGDGSTVTGTSWSGAGYQAFRWTNSTGIAAIPDLPGGDQFGEGLGLSLDGSVVVGRSSSAQSSSNDEAFRWTAATGTQGLGDLPGGPFHSIAEGASANGSIVVGFSASGVYPASSEAFRWTAATGMVGLGDLPGGSPRSYAYDVSADGDTVVGWSSSAASGVTSDEAMLWRPGKGMIGLGGLVGGTLFSEALGVSADGTTAVGFSTSNNGTEAFRWTEAAGMVSLGDVPGEYSLNEVAWDASASGSVIVGSRGYGPGARAFIWDAQNGMRDLQTVLESVLGYALPAWTLTEARGISDDGLTITGIGSFAFNPPQASTEGWVLTLPEPASPFLMCFAVALFPSPKWRKNKESVRRPPISGA